MSKEIAIKENYSIEKIKDMTAMASVLKSYVVKEKLYTEISRKNYAHVEGWQFAGGLLGLFPKVTDVHNLSSGNELKWRADVEIVNIKTGAVVSAGFAICSNKESRKKTFDEYAVLSMAQTRAIGKAYRNYIGWVMKLAGYEATPSEEMRKVGEEAKAPEETKPTPSSDGVDHIPSDHVCTAKNCGKDLTIDEANYSKKLFGKELCREHQKLARSSKK